MAPTGVFFPPPPPLSSELLLDEPDDCDGDAKGLAFEAMVGSGTLFVGAEERLIDVEAKSDWTTRE